MIRRLLPFRKKRMMGPFAFLDHMGPVEFVPNAESDIRPHPHIGLSTMTYLYEGRIIHALPDAQEDCEPSLCIIRKRKFLFTGVITSLHAW